MTFNSTKKIFNPITNSERCFVLEEKLRDLTGDENIIWQGRDDSNDLEVVEHSGGGHPNQRHASHQQQQPGSIRNLMTKFFRSPTAPPPQSPLITNSEHHQIVSTQWAFFIVLEISNNSSANHIFQITIYSV